MLSHEIIELDKKQLRDFGLVTGAIAAGIFGLLLPCLFSKTYPLWPWYVLAVLASTAMTIPMALRPIYKVWMLFGQMMGWVNTRIILGVVFYVLFTPISILLKLFGKDPMQRKIDPKSKSYRVTSVRSPREQMEKPF